MNVRAWGGPEILVGLGLGLEGVLLGWAPGQDMCMGLALGSEWKLRVRV